MPGSATSAPDVDMIQPHVFVLRADITRLAADTWLLPTDRALHVAPAWLTAVPELREAIQGLGDEALPLRDEDVAALPLPSWPPQRPLPVLVAVPYDGIRDASQAHAPLLRGCARPHRRPDSGDPQSERCPWSRFRPSARPEAVVTGCAVSSSTCSSPRRTRSRASNRWTSQSSSAIPSTWHRHRPRADQLATPGRC